MKFEVYFHGEVDGRFSVSQRGRLIRSPLSVTVEPTELIGETMNLAAAHFGVTAVDGGPISAQLTAVGLMSDLDPSFPMQCSQLDVLDSRGRLHWRQPVIGITHAQFAEALSRDRSYRSDACYLFPLPTGAGLWDANTFLEFVQSMNALADVLVRAKDLYEAWLLGAQFASSLVAGAAAVLQKHQVSLEGRNVVPRDISSQLTRPSDAARHAERLGITVEESEDLLRGSGMERDQDGRWRRGLTAEAVMAAAVVRAAEAAAFDIYEVDGPMSYSKILAMRTEMLLDALRRSETPSELELRGNEGVLEPYDWEEHELYDWERYDP